MNPGTWELISYVVTAIGLPIAIFVFIYEQRKERGNEEDQVYQQLSDNYQEFLQVALDHTELRLFSRETTPKLTDEQREQMLIIFTMLTSLFERAYLLIHARRMSARRARFWSSWDDYMHEWCEREDYRTLLPQLLRGEDPQFAAYITEVAHRGVRHLP